MNFIFNPNLFNIISGSEGRFRIYVDEPIPEGYAVIDSAPIKPIYWALPRYYMFKQKHYANSRHIVAALQCSLFLFLVYASCILGYN